MGCGLSKIELEETVTRCKDRKQFMKGAVSARNAFAAAYSAYAMSLKNTGATLSDYAQGEVQHHPNSVSPNLPGVGVGPPLPQPPVDPFPPPPPPLPHFSTFPPSPLQRAATMPEINFPKPNMKHSDPIIEEDNEDDDDDELEIESPQLKHRVSKSIGGGLGNRNGISHSEEVVQDEDLTEMPSPPPPRTAKPPIMRETPPPPPPDTKGMNNTWDFFFPPMDHIPGTTLAGLDEGRMEREEFERKVLEEREQSSEIDDVVSASVGGDVGTGRDGGARSDVKAEPVEVMENSPEPPPPQPPPQAAATKMARRVKQGVPPDGKRRGASSANLLQIFSELDDHFLKASESAHEVLKMLEAARLHYHSNFADNRGHIDHSAKVMKVITWNRSFRGLPNADDGKDDFDSEEHETHATVLDKMLAWEKKLYDEVKAGEHMKIEYQKKVASLNKLKNRGSNIDALERMKATVSHLHTRYIVDMQSMDSTVSEINRLRDEQLYPKLVTLVDGLATMWESMQVHHENQSQIVLALKALDISQSPKETTEHHHERTVQLWHIVSEWHLQFDKLVIHQKEYIRALNNWLKLNLIPIDTNLKEKVSSPQRPQRPPIQMLLNAWLDYLEKLPDELARTAINNFAAVVNTIMQYQIEEMKLRDRCDHTRRELTKKNQQFEDWYHKHMDPEEKDLVTERQLQVEVVKKRLEEEEEEYQRQCIQVREKSLTSLKSRLPELFSAMLDFSLACSDMYSYLRSNSQKLGKNEN